MKFKRNHRGSLIVVLSLVLLMAVTLTACSSSKTVEEAKVSETVEVKEEVVEVEVAEAEPTAEPTPEPTAEPTPEPTAEPAEELYIPEGIDMESTLPGEEWVSSFVGNVAEPVVVIYNDNSGRKEVVQANSEVTINPDEDMIAVYWPETSMGCTTHAISTNGLITSDYYEIEIMDSAKMRTIPERPAKVTVMGGAEDWVLEFTIMVE